MRRISRSGFVFVLAVCSMLFLALTPPLHAQQRQALQTKATAPAGDETYRPDARFAAVGPGDHAAAAQSGATPNPAATAVRPGQSELPSFSDRAAVHGAIRSHVSWTISGS